MSGNTLEFFVKMKDLMSGGLVKLAQNTQETFTKMDSGVVTVGNKINGVFARIKDSVRSATSEMMNFHRAEQNAEGGVGLRQRLSNFFSGTKQPRIVPAIVNAPADRGFSSRMSQMFGFQRKTAPPVVHNESSPGGIGSRLVSGGSNLLGMFGIATAGLVGGQMIEQSLHKVHELHVAEAALQNTMQNMGTFSVEGFEKAIKDSASLSRNVLYGKGEIIDLQSQLRLVGNIGEGEMQRLVKASADMATKFHMGLEEAGNAIAKAVNNPEMLRRLAMQLKIDPAIVEHLQKIAKSGHEAQARLELLSIVERKVGGAAIAAFNADPLARWNKFIENTKIKFGELLVPVLKWFVSAAFWLKEHKTLIINLAIGFGTYIMVTKLAAFWTTQFGSAATRAAFGARLLQAAISFGWGLLLTGISMVITQLMGLDSEEHKVIKTQQMLTDMHGQAKKGALEHVMAAQRLIDKIKDKTTTDIQAKQALYDLHNMSQTYFGGLTLATAKTDAARIAMEKYSAAIEQNAMIEAAKGKMVDLDKQYIDYKMMYESTMKGKDLSQFVNDKSIKNAATNAFNKYNIDYTQKITALTGIAQQTPIDVKEKTGGTKTPSSEGGGGGDKSIASGITSGGPRVININGVKFTDKIEIHAATMVEGTDQVEHKLEEMFLRILNSGASVQ